MLNLQTLKPRGWMQMLGTFALVGALSACGGGGDDTVVGAPTPRTPATPIAPATNPSAGIENTGNLNYLAFEVDGTTSTLAATVAFAAPNGTVTVLPGPDALDITTTDSWANVVWPTNFSGALRANGNVALVCSAEVGQGNFLLVSHNMVAVPSNQAIAAISGKTFTATECDSGTPVSRAFTVSSDGSIADESDSVSAANLAAAFGAAGWDIGDGASVKLSLYAYAVGGVTKYHIVEVGRDFLGGVLTNRVELISEQDPR